ncbi:MAG: ATP-binding protein [Thermoplasmata archaeon]
MAVSEKVRRKPVVKRCPTPPRFAGEMLSVLSEVMSVENLDAVLQKIAATVAELFSVRALIISVLEENSQVFRVRAAYGYEPERTEKLRTFTYSQERLKKDLEDKYKLMDNVYFVRPGPEEYVKADELFYFHLQDITKPRGDPSDWHELDYLKLLFTDRQGNVNGYIEVIEPVSGKVFDNGTVEAMHIFSQLAGVAIENARMYQRQVEVAQRTKFLADIIAHDINNYNQAVTSYLAMAQGEGEGLGGTSKFLERASSAAWSISELIQRASMLAKIEEEGAADMGPIELGEVLKESSATVMREFADQKTKINLSLGGNRYFVTGNEFADDIFTNILRNAVDYDPHDEVVVDVTIGEFFVDYLRYWCVSIADNGVGIPDSKKAIVFGRFNGREDTPTGTGLGLSIVRAVVEAYKGMVWVEDRVPGDHSKGSVFKVALPMTSAR